MLTETQTNAAHVGHVSLDPDKKHDPHETRFGSFLKASIKLQASDVIMKAGQPPKLRVRGQLKPLDTEAVSAEEFMSIAKHILNEEQWADLHKFGSADFAYDYDETTRYRVNLFQARGKLAIASLERFCVTTWTIRRCFFAAARICGPSHRLCVTGFS